MTTKQSSRENAPARRSQAGTSPDFPFSQMDALDVMTRAGQGYMSGVAALGEEMVNFLQTRMQHNIALGESLSRCHTFTDVANLQRDWLMETTQEYADEARKLMELGSSLMRESWTPMEEAAATAAEGSRVPVKTAPGEVSAQD